MQPRVPADAPSAHREHSGCKRKRPDRLCVHIDDFFHITEFTRDPTLPSYCFKAQVDAEPRRIVAPARGRAPESSFSSFRLCFVGSLARTERRDLRPHPDSQLHARESWARGRADVACGERLAPENSLGLYIGCSVRHAPRIERALLADLVVRRG